MEPHKVLKDVEVLRPKQNSNKQCSAHYRWQKKVQWKRRPAQLKEPLKSRLAWARKQLKANICQFSADPVGQKEAKKSVLAEELSNFLIADAVRSFVRSNL